jgi:hypothetical protein
MHAYSHMMSISFFTCTKQYQHLATQFTASIIQYDEFATEKCICFHIISLINTCLRVVTT